MWSSVYQSKFPFPFSPLCSVYLFLSFSFVSSLFLAANIVKNGSDYYLIMLRNILVRIWIIKCRFECILAHTTTKHALCFVLYYFQFSIILKPNLDNQYTISAICLVSASKPKLTYLANVKVFFFWLNAWKQRYAKQFKILSFCFPYKFIAFFILGKESVFASHQRYLCVFLFVL